MNQHPIVTYDGDEELFKGFESSLVSSLPLESVEWKRSYGRLTRSVNLDVKFTPFKDSIFSKERKPSILEYPIFHTFWTDCPDVDTYKSTVKEQIHCWVQQLKQNNVTDWMIIVVEAADLKKTNKLIPRTTVLDKLKNDFGGKQSERCISLANQTKSDSRTSESWQSLLSKMRHLIMIAYNRAINKFEEVMRAERERRTDKNWSFCNYFLLQEELAQVFRYISLEEESLIQYDELDALFTQFVLNSAAGDTPRWLLPFSQPCENWEGLFLKDGEYESLQQKIKDRNISLIEFRNYMFQRQCQLLVKLNKPWELANRALSLLNNTVTELRILNVGIYEGGTACWGFLSCLEIIYLLFRYKNSASTDSHALHCAPLWSFARDKLRELGIICGLMPNVKTSSEQMHTVINLVCGMGNDPHADNHQEKRQQSPMTRLKEALSGKEAFMKHFLDISEIAISTYKHNGRIRSARHIGRDLARFYIQEGSFLKAIPFLSDQLKTFMEENWPLLIFSTQMELANCFLEVGDKEKYVRACLSLSAMDVRQFKDKQKEYFQQAVDTVNASNGQFLMSTDRIFSVSGFELITSGPIISGTAIEVIINLTSCLPASLWCKKIEMQLKHSPEKQEKLCTKPSDDTDRKSSFARKFSSRSSNDSSELKEKANDWEGELVSDCAEKNSYKQQIKMKIELDYKQDKSLSTASVSCSNPHQVLRRRDSQSNIENFDKPPTIEASSDVLICEDFNLEPDVNMIRLTGEANKTGLFTGGQVIISTENFQFICSKVLQKGVSCLFKVVSDSSRVYLSRRNSELLAGIPQNLTLTVNSGSSLIEKDTEMKVVSTRGLLLRKLGSELPESPVKNDPEDKSNFSREICFKLSRVEPFQRTDIPLVVLSELTPQKESSVEHMVSVSSKFLKDSRADIDIHFIRPFMVTYKLQTANLKKFIQILVTGFVSSPMYLFKPHLEIENVESPPSVKILNDVDQILAVCREYSASYIWQLDVDYSKEEASSLRATFSVSYHTSMDLPLPLEQKYKYSFDVHHYKSLYTIRAKVEPAKGFEFCRVGNMSHLFISIAQVEQEGGSYPESKSVMYEVIADQTMWAVCGQSSGVFMMDVEVKKSVMIEVMPLTSGFLPLPSVRLSKYIPADAKQLRDKKSDFVGTPSSMPRLEPFNAGEIYNFNKASQIHILPSSSAVHADIAAVA